MERDFEIIEKNAEAFGGVQGGATPQFKGLCVAYKVSTKCFEELVKDGWEDTEQLVGLDQRGKTTFGPSAKRGSAAEPRAHVSTSGGGAPK